MRDQVKTVRLRLGRNVQRFRRLRGLSQETLAERAFTSLKQIGRVERGQVNVTLDLVVQIAAGLRVELCELFESDYDQPSFVPVPVRELEPLKQIFQSVERAANSRSAARRQRSR